MNKKFAVVLAVTSFIIAVLIMSSFAAADSSDGSGSIFSKISNFFKNVFSGITGAATNCSVNPDEDSDGYNNTSCEGNDCDDANVSINPGTAEVCNGIDDNCDLNVDEGGVCAVCGNNVVEAGEQCDDGNLADGDGCSATCQIEVIASCENISDVNPAVPADVCCVVNQTYDSGDCDPYGYVNCVANWAIGNLQSDALTRGKVIYYAARTEINLPSNCV